MEYELEKSAGKRCPSALTDDDIDELLILPTRSQRVKYLSFLMIRELQRKRGERLKAEKKVEIAERWELRAKKRADEHLPYGLGRNSLFIQIRESSMSLVDCYHLAQSVQFEQSIVFDMGYDEHMSKRDAKNTAQQMKLCYAHNKVHKNPFYIHLCNTAPEKQTFYEFQKMVPTIHTPRFLGNVTDKSYLDIFPRDKLMYLSPNANNELLEYDDDAIYIIGEFPSLMFP